MSQDNEEVARDMKANLAHTDSSGDSHSKEGQVHESGAVDTNPPYTTLQSNKEEDFGKLDENATLIGPNKPMPSAPGERSDYFVEWMPDDLDNPQNWKFTEKIIVCFIIALAAAVAAFGSAVISGGIEEIEEKFHVGISVAALCVSLYVAGFAVGPVIWGPSSELYGRRSPMLISMFGFVLFSFAAATAKDFQTLVLSRFFMGMFSAGALTLGPAMASDIFDNKDRGRAVAIVALMIMSAPMVAPVVGGYIGFSYLGWRWTQYITGIFAALVFVIEVFFLKETYAPKLLATRASALRVETGNWAISAPIEHLDFNVMEILRRTVMKPLIMLSVEPILMLISLYHGFIYGILYLCLEAVPIIFTSYGWKGGNVFLPYLAMFIGTIIGCAVSMLFFEPRYLKAVARERKMVLPEERLWLMIVGGVFFCMGIFLLCWSGAYKVHWIVPCIGLALFGFGFFGIFVSAFNYIIDSYLMLAATAIAANTFVRSGMAAAFPLFATQMFKNLHTQWAGTLLGCLAALLLPVPILFYIFGARIRRVSKFAINLDGLEPPQGPPARAASVHSTHSHRSRARSFLAV